MATKTETFESRVLLNAQQAKQTLALLEQQLERVRKEKKAAFAGGKDVAAFDRQIKQITASMKTLQTQELRVSETLNNLSTASYKELRATVNAINKELRSGAVERGSEQWRQMQRQLKAVKAEIAAINDESKLSQSIWQRTANWMNSNWGMVTQLVAGWSGLTMSIRSATQAYADMEEAMADTRKYTGQTDEQVRLMNEDFKKMDTRTSREQLNDLAGAAGRLGISATKDIEEFVDAADKIGVALGDDLGEGAVDKIGKLAQMFGEDNRLGLRGAMLATGSAVNDLAQSSSANAGYIVEFTNDLSGVAIQAGMTQTQLMGLASALDQNGQEAATSSTVFSQLITAMFQDPARFAKIAGVEDIAFTQLNIGVADFYPTWIRSYKDERISFSCIPVSPQLFCSSGKGLMHIQAYRAIAHRREHHRSPELKVRWKVIYDPSADVTFCLLRSPAKKDSCLHWFPERINRWVRNLACIEEHPVEVYRDILPGCPHRGKEDASCLCLQEYLLYLIIGKDSILPEPVLIFSDIYRSCRAE